MNWGFYDSYPTLLCFEISLIITKVHIVLLVSFVFFYRTKPVSASATEEPSRKRKEPSKKQKKGEASGSNPPRFTSASREARYQEIQDWKFIPERQVVLNPGEGEPFRTSIGQRNWWTLATPPPKFDPDVVREFYANAWPEESVNEDYVLKSYVRGKEILYDRDAIEALLGGPHPDMDPETIDDHHIIYLSEDGFNWNELQAHLCRPNHHAVFNGPVPLRLLRSAMNFQTQLMFTFMSANLIPNSHAADCPKETCEFLYCCVRPDYVIDAATRISAEILSNALKTLPAADNAKGVKPRFGFPSFITELCFQHGVTVNRTMKIRQPIDQKYINRWCQEDEMGGGAPAPAPAHAPAPEPAQDNVPHSIEELWAQLSLRDARRDAETAHTWDMLSAVHRQVNFAYTALHRSQRGPSRQPMPHPNLLAQAVNWPGDRPHYPGEAGGQDDEGGIQEEEDQEEDDAAHAPLG